MILLVCSCSRRKLDEDANPKFKIGDTLHVVGTHITGTVMNEWSDENHSVHYNVTYEDKNGIIRNINLDSNEVK